MWNKIQFRGRTCFTRRTKSQYHNYGEDGLSNLNKLDMLLKCPEYKEGAGITVVRQNRNGEDVPVGLHFQNAVGGR